MRSGRTIVNPEGRKARRRKGRRKRRRRRKRRS